MAVDQAVMEPKQSTVEERLGRLEAQLLLGGLGQPSGQEDIVNAINRQNAVVNKILSDEMIGKVLKGPIRVGTTSILNGAVTAEKISVLQLSALTVDAGELTAGTITGLTIRTAVSGARVEMSGKAYGGLIGYDTADTYNPDSGGGTYQILWKKSDGKLYFGGGNGILSSTGVEFKSSASGQQVQWNNGGTVRSYLNGYSTAAISHIELNATYDGSNLIHLALDANSNEPSYTASMTRGGAATPLHFVGVFTKGSDETVNNSTTLQDDNDIQIPVVPAESWWFDLFILFNSSAVADIKFGWTYPVGCTIDYHLTTDTGITSNDETSVPTVAGTGADRIVRMQGVIQNSGGNTGTVKLQWAQNTLEVSDTKVLKGSCIKLILVG